MKFDPTKWQEVKPNETYESKTGRLQVMCSDPQAALYIQAEGFEALGGVGSSIVVTATDADSWKVTAKEDARVFVYSPVRLEYEPVGEVFTNIDRKVMESGSLLEVTKAIRQFRLGLRQQQAEIARERRALDEARARAAAEPAPADPAPAEPATPEPEPDVETQADPQQK